MTGKTPLRVLLIEDSAVDAELVIYELRRAGYEPEFTRVDTEAALSAALDQGGWQLILSDHSMPALSGTVALQMVQKRGLDIPFIIVSGTMGEETAVEMMRAGATDFFLKGKTSRLPEAIRRELQDVEERRSRQRVEHQIRQLESRFSTIFHVSPTAMCILSLTDGRFINVNEQYVALHGYSRDELIGRTAAEIGIETGTPHEVVAQFFEQQSALHNMEFTLRTKSGELRHVLISIQRIELNDEPCLLSSLNDITERKKAESELRHTTERLEFLQTATATVTYTADPTQGFYTTFVSDNVVEMLGYQPAEFGPVAFWRDKIHPDDVAHVLDTLDHRNHFGITTIEYRFQRRDGSYVWLREDTRMLRDADGRPLELVGNWIDISTQKEAEQALRQSETRLRSLLENGYDGIVVLGLHGYLTYASPSTQTITGYTRDELLSMPPIEAIHPDDTDRVQAELQRILQKPGEVLLATYRIRHKDGQWRWLEVVATNMVHEPGVDGVVFNYRDVTERKVFEDSLRRANERLAFLQSATATVIFTADPAQGYHTTFVSDNVTAMLGYHPSEFGPVELWRSRVHPDDLDRVVAFLQQNTTQHATTVIYRFRHKDGHYLWLREDSHVVLDAEGKPVELVGNWIDISTQKEAEQALRQSETRFRALIENSYDGIMILGSQGTISYSSPSALSITGYGEHELVGVRPDEIVHPDDLASMQAELAAVLAQPNARAFITFRLRHRDGHWFWMESIVTNLSHEPGIAGIVVNYRDITERKRAAMELQALYDATSYLLNADGLLALGQQIVQVVVERFGQPDCGLLLLDDEREALIQLAQAGSYHVPRRDLDLTGHGMVARAIESGSPIYEPDVNAGQPSPADSADGGTRSEFVIPLVTSKGVIGVLDLQSPLPDGFGERERLLLLALAERAAAALETRQLYEEINHYAGELEWSVARRTAELHKAKEQVEAILNNSSDAIVLANLEGVIQRTNPAFGDLFGYPPDRALADQLTSHIEPDSLPVLATALQTVAQRLKPQRLELTCRRVDGTLFTADVAIAPIMEYESNELDVIYGLRDITERKQAEENLRRALDQERELSELKSRFTSMVSHEFRNPLAIIMSSSELIKLYGDRMTPERRHERLDVIHRQVERLTMLLEDILTLGKADVATLDPQREPINLIEFCGDIVRDVRMTAPDHHLDFIVSGECPPASLDPKLMRQAVTNLLTNAVKYSPGGGAVELRLDCAEGRLRLSVKDQGIGIPEEDHKYLFETFHRAQNVGDISGTGLGLAIVKRAVEAHGGEIVVESQVGVGSTFTVMLPFSENAAPDQTTTSP